MGKPKMEDNRFYKRLQKRWDELNRVDRKGKDGKELKMDLAIFLDLATTKKRDSLQSKYFTPEKDADGNPKDLDIFPIHFIHTLYAICTINPEDFLLEPTEEEKWIKKHKPTKERKEKLFTREYWQKLQPFLPAKNPNIEVKIIPTVSPNTQGDKLKEFYEDLVNNYYLKARSGFEIHEVLLKGNNQNPGNFLTYRNAQQKIFEAIDKVLEDPETSESFHYKRVFFLSPSDSIHPSPSNKTEKIRRFLLESSLETLIHINSAFNATKGLIEFYIAPFMTFRAHALIDNTLITEDYKRIIFEEESYIIPHILFIDDVSIDSDISKIKNDFDEILGNNDGGNPKPFVVKLDKTRLRKYMNDCKDYLSLELKKKEKSIETLNDILDKKRSDLEQVSNNEKGQNDAEIEISALEDLIDKETTVAKILAKQQFRFNIKYRELIGIGNN
jgi:hypothetical protein